MNEDIVGGIILGFVIVILVCSIWYLGGAWREISITQACKRDGFFYVSSTKFDCHEVK